MQATRLWRLACLLVLGSAALASCGNDEGGSPGVTPAGGAGSASGGSQATPTAGDDTGPLGGNVSSSGGSTTTAGSATGGSSANLGGDGAAGSTTPVGVSGDGSGGGAGGAGGSGPNTPPGEQLTFCPRITQKVGHADAQARAFAKAAFADCRIRWVIPLGANLDEYRQQLVIWNLQFWGCQDAPVTDFGLVFGTPALSAGDARLLIELYQTALDAEVELSASETNDMKAALNRLAKQLISSDSDEPSKPNCPANSGGTAGTAGTAGTSGTGGGTTETAGAGGVGGAL